MAAFRSAVSRDEVTMTFDRAGIELLTEAVASLEAGFADLPDIAPEYDQEAVRTVLLDTAVRMRDNYPYQHPLYAGQMLKPPHPIARLA